MQANSFHQLVFSGDRIAVTLTTPEGTEFSATWLQDSDDAEKIAELADYYEAKLFDKLKVGTAFIPSGKDEGFEADK